MVYRLILSYQGAAYAGWQRQANALAVQQVIEEALGDLLGREPRIVGAGRTDAGVHARRQVAHLELAEPFPAPGLVHGTNARLPPDIRVMEAARMADGFHALGSATAKTYSYRLVAGTVLSPLDSLFAVSLPRRFDLELAQRATALLLGRHDFTAFALSGGNHTNPVRRILDARWTVRGAEAVFEITGEGFLRGMVRSLVGTLLQVARGARDLESFQELLTGRPRPEAGPTAPAEGLVLERVYYPEPWGPVWPEGSA